MNNGLRSAVGAAAAFASVCLLMAPAAVAAQPAALTATQSRQLHTLIAERLKAAHVPGASIAIGKNSQIVWSEAFGLADVENNVPARTDTRFRTASIGKSMTATAAMQMAERGELDLDAEVQRYCPRYPRKDQPITVRELITHTSGIRHYEGPSAASEEYITRHYDNVSDAIDIFATDPLVQKPGADFHYTTWGYVVLGCVLEGAARVDFRSLMTQRIFAPASMASTRDDDPRALIPHRVSGYVFTEGKLTNSQFADMSAKMAAGGFLTTAPDLVRFMNYWMLPGYVSAATRQKMLTPYRLPNGNGTVDGFGMGMFLDEVEGHRAGLYGGGTAGGTGVIMFIPDLQLSIAGLFNLENYPAAERTKLAREIATAVIREAG
jgi:CubicO group peptidase (beta-lactamase class C family)